MTRPNRATHSWRGTADALRARWPLTVAVLVLSGIGNIMGQPRWTEVQLAADAATFRDLTGDPLRIALSAAFDLIIAASYGALGVAATSAARTRGRAAFAAAAGVIAGAAFDELENILALLNLARRATVTDVWIYAMRAAGAFKLLAFAGGLVWIVLLVNERIRRPAR